MVTSQWVHNRTDLVKSAITHRNRTDWAQWWVLTQRVNVFFSMSTSQNLFLNTTKKAVVTFLLVFVSAVR